jgi:hypothetical protein
MRIIRSASSIAVTRTRVSTVFDRPLVSNAALCTLIDVARRSHHFPMHMLFETEAPKSAQDALSDAVTSEQSLGALKLF